jgi:glycosyltransferase involved in cell wall biosynthesis
LILTLISYITLFFFGLRFVVAALNVFFSPVLKTGRQKGDPLVSILIPARNEEDHLDNILTDLQRQSYRNLEVLVFNDESTDRTKELAEGYAIADDRFRVIDSGGLPEGWLGKSHGCHQLAEQSRGDYLLFLDADVRLEPGLIENGLAQMQNHHLKMLSVFPQQEMQTWGEKMAVPVMNFILLSLLPMILTRESSRSSLSAANGQFMLFETNTYHHLKPHEQARKEPAEDILIARLYKKNGYKIQCMTGNQTIRCRMYKNLTEAINGFTKNIAEFFGGSLFTAFLYWLIGTVGIFTVIFTQSPAFILLLLLFITGINLFVSISAKQSFKQNLFLAIPRQLILGVIIFLAFKNKLQKKTLWKGRNIS